MIIAAARSYLLHHNHNSLIIIHIIVIKLDHSLTKEREPKSDQNRWTYFHNAIPIFAFMTVSVLEAHTYCQLRLACAATDNLLHVTVVVATKVFCLQEMNRISIGINIFDQT